MGSDTRLLLLVTELQMGGAARVVRDLAAALSTRFRTYEAVFNCADGVDFPGHEPISLDVGGGGGMVRKLRNLYRRVARLRRIKAQLGIDVSISHLEGAHWVDVLSRGREKIILCVHGGIVHNGHIRGFSGWFRSRVVAPLVYNRADRVVAVSRGIQRDLVSLGVRPDKLLTINNSFDLESIEKRSHEPLSAAEQALFDGAPVLITVGRLASEKNQAALADIMTHLLDRRKARLLILGDGPERRQLLEKAHRSGLRVWDAWNGEALDPRRDVYFLGRQENPFRWLGRADLFLFPSSWEGFPLALCEAMICGVPAVTTDCPTGPREILAPHSPEPLRPLGAAEQVATGVLMPLLHHAATRDASIATWVDTIDRLLGDPALLASLARAARQRMNDFSQERIVGQWVDLIEELAGRINSPAS